MPLTFYTTTGLSLYARFDDGSNTAVNLTEGSSLNTGKYEAADSAIATAGLAAREKPYTGRIFVGTAGSQASGDTQVGDFDGFYWQGAVEGTIAPVVGRKLVKYNGTVEGNLLPTFARAQTTVDDAGSAIAANVRRFCAEDRSAMGFIDWQASGLDLGTSAAIYTSGEAADGTPLIVLADGAASAIRVVEVDDVKRTAKVASTTLYSALPGTAGAIDYVPKSAVVEEGLIVVGAARRSSSSVVGVTLFASQDQGATWSRIEVAATHGGGFDIPTTAYGSNANGINRHREWALSAFWRDGELWILGTDYLISGGSTAKGFQFFMVKATPDETTGVFTLGKIRIVYERWESSVASTVHGHTMGMMESGLLIAAIGDSSPHNAIFAIEIDLENYETATPTVTQIFGELDPGTTSGRECPQISMFAPAPDGGLLGSNDLWPSPILHIPPMESASDPFAMDGPLYMPPDYTAGAVWNGWGNIFLRGKPSTGYVVGGYDATFPAIRHYSPDGERWAAMTNCDAIEGPVVKVGNCFAAVRASDEMLMLAPVPTVRTLRPLKIAPGADNKLTTSQPAVLGAPSGSNTVRFATFVSGVLTYTDDSTPVVNAPKVPAPLNNPVYVVLSAADASSYWHGSIYLQESGQTINGSNNLLLACYIANLGSQATGYFGSAFGGAGVTNDLVTERAFKPDRTAGQWVPAVFSGDPTNNNTLRGAMTLTAGINSTTPNVECPMVVAIGGLYEASLVPWPCARLSTSNANEIEVIALERSTSPAWTNTVALFRPDLSPTITNSNLTPDGTLYTVWRDANNYATVSWDGANKRITVASTVAGGSAGSFNVMVDDWLRTWPLIVMLSDNGTALECTLLSCKDGCVTGSNATGSLKGQPTELRLSNAAKSAVHTLDVGAVEHIDQYLTQQQREAKLVTLEALATDEDLAAEKISAAVDAQLAASFASLNTQVLTRASQVTADAIQEDTTDVVGYLPAEGPLASAEQIAEVKAVTDVLNPLLPATTIAAAEDVEGAGGTTQPRINRKPDPGFTIQVSRRSDGTYKCTKPIRLTAGAVQDVYVFIDMSPLFGPDNFVQTVGTASVSAGSITEGDDKGPRDTYAVLELDGTADDACEVTVPVTMTSGTTVPVVFDVELLE